MDNGGMVYEAIAEAANDTMPDDHDIVPWDEYEGMDRHIYEAAAAKLIEQGVVFP